jgi:hypothetical protein
MGPNFLECDRDQVLLLPPSLREWLPEGHLAWFVIDAVERMELSAFYGGLDLTRFGGHVGAGLGSLLLDHVGYGCEPRSGEARTGSLRVLFS